jgi:hypothetical protein
MLLMMWVGVIVAMIGSKFPFFVGRGLGLEQICVYVAGVAKRLPLRVILVIVPCLVECAEL